jgi:hypothetical protein
MISRVNKQPMEKKKTTLKPLPRFVSEDEERKFWDTHDSAGYIDWSKAERGILFPNLKCSSTAKRLRAMPPRMEGRSGSS